VAVSDADILSTLSVYLERYPAEAELLAEPVRLLSQGGMLASRRTYPMHVTVGALLIRSDAEILLVEHCAYGIMLQPGGHVELSDNSLVDASVRELTEETGVDPDSILLASQSPAYIEYGQVPARPEKGEPDHFHLDIGYNFVTVYGDVGRIQESEVRSAGWYPLAVAERVVGHRIARGVSAAGRRPVGCPLHHDHS
jgi:8-oxo-dGTP pyrophosphatase MutT (NUDIX family)